eukprot:Mrub_00640.p1 GENE.Mrub_00640~~Mrub_00640.p1  ORF type:complete len:668 (-),score=115.52 Mrub_00640:5-2008(-)
MMNQGATKSSKLVLMITLSLVLKTKGRGYKMIFYEEKRKSESANLRKRWKIIKVVGNGSFGHAVLVQSVQDKKLYIMKIIDVSKMDRKQKEEALNEVHVLKAMRHPYIVTYRESFMDKRCLCIVMDYADGGDMFKRIAKQKQIGTGFSENTILDWFVQISLAIKHIHDRKILHRDLKTQNIFLNNKGEVKMGDFGIARVLQHTYDCAQTAIGTPYYLSPEICQEQPYNQKSDVWSLGCILYEMVTLKHAFDANSMKGLVLKILRGSYPPIPEMYSNEMKGLIAEMLNKDPKKRPSVKKILEKDFLAERIASLIPMSIVKQELGNTFVNKQQNKNKESESESNINNYSTTNSTNSKLTHSSSNSSLNSKRGENRDKEVKLTYEPNSESDRVQRGLSRNSSQHNLPKTDALQNKDININLNLNDNLTNRNSSNIDRPLRDISNNPSSNKYKNNNLMKDNSKASIYNKENINSNHNYSDIKTPYTSSTTNNNYPLSSRTNDPSSQSISSNHSLCSVNEQSKSSIQSVKSSKEYRSVQQEEGYEDLLSSIKDVLSYKNKGDKDKRHEEEDMGKETEDKRTFQTFLTPDGKKIELEGIDERDSMYTRIEALRIYLEKAITDMLFCKAYHILSDPNYDDEGNSELYKLMGSKSKFIPLVYQLIVCEDHYFTNQ